jgi:hypothetical protein
MIVKKEDLYKVKDPASFAYEVFKIHSKMFYEGSALVAACDERDANHIIDDLKQNDTNNQWYSQGYCYVDENDFTGEYSDIRGILTNNIHYEGLSF